MYFKFNRKPGTCFADSLPNVFDDRSNLHHQNPKAEISSDYPEYIKSFLYP
jgi:hypothetical protein